MAGAAGGAVVVVDAPWIASLLVSVGWMAVDPPCSTWKSRIIPQITSVPSSAGNTKMAVKSLLSNFRCM